MIRAFEDKVPQLGTNVYVDVSAQVVGYVTLEDDVSVYPCAVVRGDDEPVVVGAGSVVEDGCLLHADAGGLTVGRRVVMGHGAIVHGARVGDGTLVCMGSTILKDSVIGEGCIIAAGAVVTEGAVIPPHSVVMGVPGRVVRQTTLQERERIAYSCDYYVDLNRRYRAGGLRVIEPDGVYTGVEQPEGPGIR